MIGTQIIYKLQLYIRFFFIGYKNNKIKVY